MSRSDGGAARNLGDIAQLHFRLLLQYWTGADHRAPQEPSPDNSKIDITHTVDAISGEVGTIQFNWQVKATGKNPPRTNSAYLGCQCWKVELDEGYVAGLREVAQSLPTFYLALGILADPDRPRQVLPLVSPDRSFTWYAVDLKQFFSRIPPRTKLSAIEVPVQNRLNLALFSLLWGSLWVKAYVDPITPTLDLPKTTLDLVDQIDRPLKRIGPALDGALAAALPEMSELAKDASHFHLHRLAIFCALRSISHRVLSTPDGFAQIETYSPEALTGTANLWLFSRTYHEFMRTSVTVALQSIRYLPVDMDQDFSRRPYFAMSLFHVRKLYQLLGAQDVSLVQRLPESGGDDYSYWDGKMRTFRWVHLDTDGYMVLDGSRLSADADIDRDALRQADALRLEGSRSGDRLPGVGIWEWLRTPDEELIPTIPVCLFPAEDRYIQYPSQLWSWPARRLDLGH